MLSFLTSLAGSAALGWIGRRILEVGGWLALAVSTISALPPAYQELVLAVLTGQGGAQSIAAYFGLAVYIVSQVMSWRETTKPQVVADGQKVGLTEEQARQAVYEQTGRYPTGPIEDRTRR